jgi:hypothetical protein
MDTTEEQSLLCGPCRDVISRTAGAMNQHKTLAFTFLIYVLRTPEAQLTLNGQNIPFVNHVKYLGVIFDKRITWRLNI